MNIAAGRMPDAGEPAHSVLDAERGGARTLGPVADLERHLPSDWWRTLFNAVYLKTDGDMVENDEATHAEVDLVLAAAPLTPDMRILDLCCGQGRHTLELARRGFRHLSGLDRSQYLIRLARRRAKERSLPASFHEGDARRIGPRFRDLDAVLVLGNSFGYFDREEDDLAVLGAIKGALRSGGLLVMDLSDGEWTRTGFEPRSWEWIDQDQFVCRERSLSADGRRLVSREVVVHAEQGVIADQFYAERLYSRDSLAALLTRGGFLDVNISDGHAGLSTRRQDLGMMARRLLVTARAPSRAARPQVRRRSVTVVLGDPGMPDAIKRDGVFNAEDLDTVQRLKDALGRDAGLKARYLHDHGTLLTELPRLSTDLVLNFCDEGFRNDARMELHVAAYLEMLGLPYTGSPPAALAVCYDKSLVRAIAQELGIAVPMETYVRVDDSGATLPSVFPAFVKPALGDSSIGITQRSLVNTPEELIETLNDARRAWPDRPFLIQEFLSGEEYSVGLIGNPGNGLNDLPILKVDYRGLADGLPHLLGYESKWLPNSPYWRDVRYVQADIDRETRRELVHAARVLFERLGLRDYGRFDFRADAAGAIKLLEVNPNPGWCWDGKLNLMAEFDGMSYSDLLQAIVTAAETRLGQDPISARALAQTTDAGP